MEVSLSSTKWNAKVLTDGSKMSPIKIFYIWARYGQLVAQMYGYLCNLCVEQNKLGHCAITLGGVLLPAGLRECILD